MHIWELIDIHMVGNEKKWKGEGVNAWLEKSYRERNYTEKVCEEGMG